MQSGKSTLEIGWKIEYRIDGGMNWNGTIAIRTANLRMPISAIYGKMRKKNLFVCYPLVVVLFLSYYNVVYSTGTEVR